jgi:hypothetical protein
MPISTYQLGIGMNIFLNLDIGYEHEYSNPLEMDISSRFI